MLTRESMPQLAANLEKHMRRSVLPLLAAALLAVLPLSSFAQPEADIIIVVDTSGTMAAEVAAFQNGFVDGYYATVASAGIDLRIVLIADSGDICLPPPVGSGSCSDDENLPLYRHVDIGVGSQDALSTLLGVYGLYSDSLRPGSYRSVVVISDDEAASTPDATEFNDALLQLDADFTGYKFHGIVPPENCQGYSSIYHSLAAQSGGEIFDICGTYGDAGLPQALLEIANIVIADVGVPPQTRCADGVDNDGDMLIDLADPGCSDPSDDDEANAPPPPHSMTCASYVTTLTELQTEVEALSTSNVTIKLLGTTLANVARALNAGRFRIARNHLAKFIGSATQRSNVPSGHRNAVSLQQANFLICSAANVMLGIGSL